MENPLPILYLWEWGTLIKLQKRCCIHWTIYITQRGKSLHRRITVSTSGIAKMIKKMAEDGLKVNLALSLHAGA